MLTPLFKYKRKSQSCKRFKTDEERKQAGKASVQRYKERNKERFKQLTKVGYAQRKENYSKIKIPETLICCRCKECKHNSHFPKAIDRKTGRKPWCLECNKVAYGSGDYLLKRMLGGARSRSKELNIPFNLTFEYLKTLKVDVCPILNVPLQWNRQVGKDYRSNDSKDYRPSLDRLVPKLGYIMGNVKIVSYRGNRIRTDATLNELKNIVKYVEFITG